MTINHPEQKSCRIVSNGAGNWTDGLAVDIEWTFVFRGSRAGLYDAAGIAVTLTPPAGPRLLSAQLHIVERAPSSGTIEKEERFDLYQQGPGWRCGFDWSSTVNNPEQELEISIVVDDQYQPQVLLRDPLSRRRNFLMSFSA